MNARATGDQVARTRLKWWGARDGYIPGLDGLRALAVLAVVLYHVFPQVVPGGFLGVDIFFVLSGFLVSTLLLREVDKYKQANLPQFWLRRARRLIPAFVLLIIVVVPVAAVVNRDLVVGIGRQIIGALTFSTNWVEIAHGTSYFDQTAPLLFKNFWSLAIEEQFYLVWPLVFLALIAGVRRPRTRAAFALGLSLVSALLMAVLFNPEHVTRVYYGTDTHSFGLALGIVLAFAWNRPKSTLPAPIRKFFSAPLADAAGFGALILVGLAMRFMNDQAALTYRGGMYAVCLLVLAVLCALLRPGSVLARAGELGVLRWVGTRSYGIYLWHWPVLVIATAAFPVAIGSAAELVRSAAALVVTGIICELSFRFVETPVRKLGFKAAYASFVQALKARRAVQVLALIGTLLTVATLVVAATAPRKSSTQLAIEAGQQETAGDAAATASATDATGQNADNGTGSDTDKGADTGAENETDSAMDDGDPSKLSPTLDASDPKPEEFTAIGDSMFSASKQGFEYYIPGIKVLATPSKQWGQALDMVKQDLSNNQVGRIVVLGFGTNAGLESAEPVEQVLSALGRDRIVLLVNLYSPSTFVPKTNQILAEVADKHANVHLVDWYSVASQNPKLLAVDQTHTSIEGANTLAQLVLQEAKDFCTELRKQGAKDGATQDASAQTGTADKNTKTVAFDTTEPKTDEFTAIGDSVLLAS